MEVLLNAFNTIMTIKATQKTMSQKYSSLQPSNSANIQDQQRCLLGVIQEPSPGEPSRRGSKMSLILEQIASVTPHEMLHF